MKTKRSNSAQKVCLELKYCERCGGLWLRPVGGGQIYCATCGREMAELPPPSSEAETARVPQGPRWGASGSGRFEGYDEDEEVDLDEAGGVA